MKSETLFKKEPICTRVISLWGAALLPEPHGFISILIPKCTMSLKTFVPMAVSISQGPNCVLPRLLFDCDSLFCLTK